MRNLYSRSASGRFELWAIRISGSVKCIFSVIFGLLFPVFPAFSGDSGHFVRRRWSDPSCRGYTEVARIRRSVFYVFGLRNSHIPGNKPPASIPTRKLCPVLSCSPCILSETLRIPHRPRRMEPPRRIHLSNTTICTLPDRDSWC